MAKRDLTVKVNLEVTGKNEITEKGKVVQENLNNLLASISDLVEFEVNAEISPVTEQAGTVAYTEPKNGMLIELPEITDEISESIKEWSGPLGEYTTSMLLLEIARREKRDQINKNRKSWGKGEID